MMDYGATNVLSGLTINGIIVYFPGGSKQEEVLKVNLL